MIKVIVIIWGWENLTLICQPESSCSTYLAVLESGQWLILTSFSTTLWAAAISCYLALCILHIGLIYYNIYFFSSLVRRPLNKKSGRVSRLYIQSLTLQQQLINKQMRHKHKSCILVASCMGLSSKNRSWLDNRIDCFIVPPLISHWVRQHYLLILFWWDDK